MWAAVLAVAIAWTASAGTLHVRPVSSVTGATSGRGSRAAQADETLRSESERAARLIEDARRELTSERYDRAIDLLLEAQPLVFPRGPYALRRDLLRGLGAAHGELGRDDRALELFAALDSLAQEHRDTATEAVAKYNAITARRKQMEELPDFEQRPSLISAAHALVAVVNQSGEAVQRARAHRTLADLIGPDLESCGCV